jgi:hypothetical protein
LFSGDVGATEAAGIESGEGMVWFGRIPYTIFQVKQILIYDPITADTTGYLFLVGLVGDKFLPCGNIDPVDVRESYGWCSAGEVYLFGTGISSHLYNFSSGRSSYDRVIYE